MRYYRTKDGRIIKESDIPDYWGGLVAVVGLDLDYRVAENLEELFDEYMLENKDHTYQSFLVKSDCYDKRSFSDSFTKDVKNGWLSYCDEYLKNGCEIYGTVIVRGAHDEPMLKSVAKMNEKGEWELL